MLGECCPPGRDSTLNLFVLCFVSDAVSLSQVDVAFNVLDLGVLDIIILVCRFLSSPLCSTCSSSDPNFHFLQLILVAFVVVHVVYYSIYQYVVGEVKMIEIFAFISPSLWFPKVNRRNMLSSASVNSLGDKVSSCHASPLILILLLSLCM